MQQEKDNEFSFEKVFLVFSCFLSFLFKNRKNRKFSEIKSLNTISKMSVAKYRENLFYANYFYLLGNCLCSSLAVIGGVFSVENIKMLQVEYFCWKTLNLWKIKVQLHSKIFAFRVRIFKLNSWFKPQEKDQNSIA